GQLERSREPVLDRQRAIHHDRLQRGALGLVALRHPLAIAIPVDLRRLGHPVPYLRNPPGPPGGLPNLLTLVPAPQPANGRSKAFSRAFASASVRAVVTNTISMPRIASTLS